VREFALLSAEILDRMVRGNIVIGHESTCGARDQPAEAFAGRWIRMSICRNPALKRLS